MITSNIGLGLGETLFFGLDWSEVISPGAAITSSQWVSAGASDESATLQDFTNGGFNGMITRLRLSGGTSGITCYWHNTITTDSGETHERTLAVKTISK